MKRKKTFLDTSKRNNKHPSTSENSIIISFFPKNCLQFSTTSNIDHPTSTPTPHQPPPSSHPSHRSPLGSRVGRKLPRSAVEWLGLLAASLPPRPAKPAKPEGSCTNGLLLGLVLGACFWGCFWDVWGLFGILWDCIVWGVFGLFGIVFLCGVSTPKNGHSQRAFLLLCSSKCLCEVPVFQ